VRLLEYQAKELFKEYDIRVPDSIASKDIESGRKDAEKIGYPFVIKVVERLVEYKSVIMKMNLN